MDKLIICCTPYQIFLIDLIVKTYKIGGIHLIYFGKIDKKTKLYFEKIRPNVEKLNFFEIGEGKRLKEILLFKKFVHETLEEKYHEVWFANFNALEIKIINSICSFDYYVGFDDGLGSINKKSGLYRESDSILRFLFYYSLGIRINDFHLFRFVEKYYGVYDKKLYPFKKIYPITYNFDNDFHSKGDEILNFFVAQPFDEEKLDYKKLESFLNKNNVKFFFPHHRQNYFLKSLEVIDTQYLFEDYIIDIISSKKYSQIVIYSINSSVLLNCVNFDGVSCISLKSEKLYSEYKFIYDLMEVSGIKVVDYVSS